MRLLERPCSSTALLLRYLVWQGCLGLQQPAPSTHPLPLLLMTSCNHRTTTAPFGHMMICESDMALWLGNDTSCLSLTWTAKRGRGKAIHR